MSAVFRTEVAPGVYRQEEADCSRSEHDQAVEAHLRNLDGSDLIDALSEAPAALGFAVATGDRVTIGEVVLAVIHAYACQLADIKVYGPDNIRSPSMEEAGCAALLKSAHDKAQPRRFTGEPLTGFGGLA